MLHAIQNGLKLAAADEVKLLNARIEYRRKRMANLRAMQQVLRQHHNEDLRKRAQLLDGLERKLDAAGTDGFDAILDEFERSEHPIETQHSALSTQHCDEDPERWDGMG